MKDFKFFSKDKEIPIYIRRLHAFNSKLAELYHMRTNFPYDSNEFGITVSICDNVNRAINSGHATRYQEISWFYHAKFLNEFSVDYQPTREIVDLIINQVENEIV
jgi:hypothetical protein